MTAKERAHKVAEYISDRVAFGGILKINFQDEVERHITEAEREAREKAEALNTEMLSKLTSVTALVDIDEIVDFIIHISNEYIVMRDRLAAADAWHARDAEVEESSPDVAKARIELKAALASEREAREKAEAQLISARDVIFYSDHQKFCPKLNCEPGHNCTCGYSAAFAVYESYASAGQSLIARLAAAERAADVAVDALKHNWWYPSPESVESVKAYEALKPK